MVNPSLELKSEEAGTTGITGITGISLLVRYAEPFFHKAFSSFVPVFPVFPVVLFAQPRTGVWLRGDGLKSRHNLIGLARADLRTQLQVALVDQHVSHDIVVLIG